MRPSIVGGSALRTPRFLVGQGTKSAPLPVLTEGELGLIDTATEFSWFEGCFFSAFFSFKSLSGMAG